MSKERSFGICQECKRVSYAVLDAYKRLILLLVEDTVFEDCTMRPMHPQGY